MKQMKVDAIKDGTVIDHIPGGKALLVLKILNGGGKDLVSVGMNLSSPKLGRKDIVKIENHELTADDVNRIALVAPTATITIIRNYETQDKWKVELPGVLENIAHCPNSNCITNVEKLKSRFDKTKNNSDYMCHYCEKIYDADELRIKISKEFPL